MEIVERRHQVVGVSFEQMPVPIERDSDRRVPDDCLHLLRCRRSVDEQSGCGVAQVVESGESDQ